MNASRLYILLLAGLLAACQQELYSALSEADCNEALEVLLAAGVDAGKASHDNGKTWVLTVPESYTVVALELLRTRGLPRSKHSSLGEMFKKDGLVSTPVEERVRFVYGISQELSETLSRMDGVVTARVHIVLPNNDPLAKEAKPASASVFIKYMPDMAITGLMAPIKNLVSHSVEGLSYENVSITFVPGERREAALLRPTRDGLIFGWLAGGGAALLFLAAGLFLALRRPALLRAWWARLRRRESS